MSRINSAVVAFFLFHFPLPIHCWNSPAILSSRREILQKLTRGGLAGVVIAKYPPLEALAAEEESSQQESQDAASAPKSSKPSAPIELLVPATRVKWTIDQATRIAESSNPDWLQLQALLLQPQNYTNNAFPNVPTAPAKAYLDTYQRNREKLNILAQPGALLVQSGEIAAWKRLKRQERDLEEQDEIRAALNLYTSALSFSAESYLLNVPLAERKQMIRNDRLPDVKQVIQSDMGVRYLIRNELLSSMDEVRSELEYQLHQPEPRSNEDLVALLKEAQSECNQWFALIDDKDVEDAMNIVTREKERS